jgi:hypothetical protein
VDAAAKFHWEVDHRQWIAGTAFYRVLGVAARPVWWASLVIAVAMNVALLSMAVSVPMCVRRAPSAVGLTRLLQQRRACGDGSR